MFDDRNLTVSGCDGDLGSQCRGARKGQRRGKRCKNGFGL